MIEEIMAVFLPPVAAALLLYIWLAFFFRPTAAKPGAAESGGDFLEWGRRIGASFCLLLFLNAWVYVGESLDVNGYLYALSHQTNIYEDHYVDPLSVAITEGERRNLIYIYLESMETTYAATCDGGAQRINYIPNLTRLAAENLSFSDKKALGGFLSPPGTTWTMGALFASSTGLPFAFPVDGNSMNEREYFAAGVTALGDILADHGYRQMFLCGSDGTFAGRKTFFEQHGGYTVFDYDVAKAYGYIAPDYRVWWGFEDAILYEIAKDRATELAAGGPFNLTLLTVDTHHVDGYVCPLCKNEHSIQLGNDMMACADRLLLEFISWCKEQDFYQDTLIVISGDHPRMDKTLVCGVDAGIAPSTTAFCRRTKGAGSTRNRVFTTMDLFPTVLSALGFEIEGDRLGLGTDLFPPGKPWRKSMSCLYPRGIGEILLLLCGHLFQINLKDETEKPIGQRPVIAAVGQFQAVRLWEMTRN